MILIQLWQFMNLDSTDIICLFLFYTFILGIEFLTLYILHFILCILFLAVYKGYKFQLPNRPLQQGLYFLLLPSVYSQYGPYFITKTNPRNLLLLNVNHFIWPKYFLLQGVNISYYKGWMKNFSRSVLATKKGKYPYLWLLTLCLS